MKIKRLKIDFADKTLVDISFEINNSLALVGPRGSGKSLTLKAILGMLDSKLSLELKKDDNFERNVSLVPQNPFSALSPLTKIKKQFFCEEDKIKKLFEYVGLDEDLLDRYPPELSGGQLQRVVIAISLENNPKLLLLDEPTTALDPKNTQMILDLLKNLQQKMGFKMLFVTHDIASAAQICEDICVIKNGKIVEVGKMEEVLNNPKEEYTKILIESNFANRKYRQ